MYKRIWPLAIVCAGIVGCNTNTSPGNIVDTTRAALSMAVGTLNDNQGAMNTLVPGAEPGAGVFLNVVTAFRNQFGNSAFLNPGTAQLTGNALAVALGGLFSYGQAPATNGTGGMPPAYSPANSVAAGYATGFILTGAAPTPAKYTIVATLSANGQMRNYNTSATLPASPTVLGNDTGGSYAPDASGDGGGTFTFNAPPAGVTESVVYILLPPVPPATAATPVAAAEVKTGTNTAMLPAGTLISGTAYEAVVIGADYPLVEAGPPQNTQASPTLVGANGTADLTASALLNFNG